LARESARPIAQHTSRIWTRSCRFRKSPYALTCRGRGIRFGSSRRRVHLRRLPGVDQIFIVLGRPEPARCRPPPKTPRMWASTATGRVGQPLSASQPPRYYRRRHAHHSRRMANDGSRDDELAPLVADRAWVRGLPLPLTERSIGAPLRLCLVLARIAVALAVACTNAWYAIAFHSAPLRKLRAAIASGHARVRPVFETDCIDRSTSRPGYPSTRLLRDSSGTFTSSRGRWRDRPRPPIAARHADGERAWTSSLNSKSDGRHLSSPTRPTPSTPPPVTARASLWRSISPRHEHETARTDSGSRFGTIANYTSARTASSLRSRIDLARALRFERRLGVEHARTSSAREPTPTAVSFAS